MTYEQFDLVVVPFPFTDRQAEKRRPALVLSKAKTFQGKIPFLVLAMVTSEENEGWPLDTPIKYHLEAGLTAPSKIRMKIFTLNQDLIVRKIGKLHKVDQKFFRKNLSALWGI